MAALTRAARASALATWQNRAGTIGYEVLTSLGRRYRRVYRA
jgi:alanine racemase